MDKYKIEKKIGTGVLANVFLVTNTKEPSAQPLVLKEVECLDVPSAESAIEQFRIFHRINHRFVCKLRESFVQWDSKVSTVSCCYVMDYFEHGDLMTHLNQMRANKEKVPFSTLQKWIGTIVEGMNYLHLNGLVHRNLKPSSLYIRPIQHNKRIESGRSHALDESTQLLIGDYGVLTIMKDAKTKTRIMPGAFDYTAPEIFDAALYDFKSDVWTIATVILDMCTTSIYDFKNFHFSLINMRHDDDVLNKILDDIYQVYESRSLVHIVQAMLNKNKDKRPSMKAVIHDVFIQDCLELVESELVLYSNYTNPHQSEHLPVEQSVTAYCDFLREHIHSESTVQPAVERLAEIASRQFMVFENESNQRLLFKLMCRFCNNEKTQLATLRVLACSLDQLIHQSRKQKPPTTVLHFYRADFLDSFFYIYLKYHASRELQLAALQNISLFSNYENVVNQLATFDVVKYLLQTLRNHATDAAVCALACKCIWLLSVNHNVFDTLSNKKCLLHARNVLLDQQKDAHCVEMACNLALAVCSNGSLVAQEESEVNITAMLLRALQRHVASAHIVTSSCKLFAALINFSEECAFRFLFSSDDEDINVGKKGSSANEIDGLDLLQCAYVQHRDDSDVVAAICVVLKQLAAYPEIATEMRSLRLHETLVDEIARRFCDDPRIAVYCAHISDQLASKASNRDSNNSNDITCNQSQTGVRQQPPVIIA